MVCFAIVACLDPALRRRIVAVISQNSGQSLPKQNQKPRIWRNCYSILFYLYFTSSILVPAGTTTEFTPRSKTRGFRKKARRQKPGDLADVVARPPKAE